MPICSPWASYESRLQRVIAHIHDHLEDDLDMDRLGEIACLSPWHWHRIYRAVQGETLQATVKRLRLQRAARALIATGRSVAEIARDSGYPNVQSFTRTFSAAYGKPPAEFRKTGLHVNLSQAILNGDNSMYDVIFRDEPPVDAIGIDHTGPYTEIGQAFDRLNGLARSRGLFGPGARIYGVYYDDPEGRDPRTLRSVACLSTSDTARPVEPPLRRLKIAGGRYAVLTHKGPYSSLPLAYQWLYQQWLRSADVEVRNEPPIEIYLNTPMDTAPQDLITEICIPVM
nr:AraC family transcriptional regulator [uncultured Gellertiella sp.]